MHNITVWERNREKLIKICLDFIPKRVYTVIKHQTELKNKGVNSMDTMMLKSAIYRKYRTITDFSKAIGWSSSKMSRLLGGRYLPDVVEATAISTLLDLQTDEFMKIFYVSHPKT